LLESLYLNTKKKIQHHNIKIKIKQNIPNSITLLRLIVLPCLIYSINKQNTLATSAFFLISIGTDFLDGFIARKINQISKFGAYLDVIADFLFITTIYLTFIINEIYSPWILLTIFFVFIQFIVSNIILKQTIYDPIGKYFGSVLFAGIGVTILLSNDLIPTSNIFSNQLIYDIITAIIVIFAVLSLLSRSKYLLKRKK
jgi:phosphatidylglycerophosphate synthase